MAEHTATLTKVDDDVWGKLLVKFYRIDITSAGTDGYTLSPAALGLRRIKEVIVTGGQEGAGYVMVYNSTALGDQAGGGKLNVYGGAGALDFTEIVSGNLGEFRFIVLGY